MFDNLSVWQLAGIFIALALIVLGISAPALRARPTELETRNSDDSDGSETNASMLTPATKFHPTRAAAMRAPVLRMESTPTGDDRVSEAFKRATIGPVNPSVIYLTPAEIQSGLSRVKWAQGLIEQLPPSHEGRNSWLLNYADGRNGATPDFYRGQLGQPYVDPDATVDGRLVQRDASRRPRDGGAYDVRYGEGRFGRIEGSGKHSEVL